MNMLKKILPLVFSALMVLPVAGCSGNQAASVPAETSVPDVVSSTASGAETSSGATSTASELEVRFGESEPFVIHLYDNETAAAIAGYVGTADWQLPIYHYDDYDNWEVMQYYDIPSRYEIPSNPEQVTSEWGGAVYYSEPNRIILFYQAAEVSGEYTPVGYVDYTEELVDAVNNNPVVPGWSNKLIHISDRK